MKAAKLLANLSNANYFSAYQARCGNLGSPDKDLLISGGKTHYGYGKAVDNETVFDLASLTKPLMTGKMYFDLIQQTGPEILKQKALKGYDFTIEDLLDHKAGLSPFFDIEEKLKGRIIMQPIEFIKELLSGSEIKAPGERVYSDIGYITLKALYEYFRKSNLSDDFIKKQKNHACFFLEVFPLYSVAATKFSKKRERLLCAEVEDENSAFLGRKYSGHAGLFGHCGFIRDELFFWHSAYKERKLSQFLSSDGKLLSFDTLSPGGAVEGIFDQGSCHGHHGYTGTSFWFEVDSGNFVILLTNRNHPVESERDFRPIRKECFKQMWKDWSEMQ